MFKIFFYFLFFYHCKAYTKDPEWDGSGCPKGATGAFPYALDCKRFFNCWKGRGMLSVCAPGTLFNPETLECDFPMKVKCYTNPGIQGSSSNYEEFRDPQNPHSHHYHQDPSTRRHQNQEGHFHHSPEYHKNHGLPPWVQYHNDQNRRYNPQGQIPVDTPFFQHSPEHHQGDPLYASQQTQHKLNNFQHSPEYHGKTLFNPALQGYGQQGVHHHHHHQHPQLPSPSFLPIYPYPRQRSREPSDPSFGGNQNPPQNQPQGQVPEIPLQFPPSPSAPKLGDSQGRNVRFPSPNLQPPPSGSQNFIPVDKRFEERPPIQPLPSRDLKPPQAPPNLTPVDKRFENPAFSHGGVQPPSKPLDSKPLPGTKNPFAKDTNYSPVYNEKPTYGVIENQPENKTDWPPKFPAYPGSQDLPDTYNAPLDSYGLPVTNQRIPENQGVKFPAYPGSQDLPDTYNTPDDSTHTGSPVNQRIPEIQNQGRTPKIQNIPNYNPQQELPYPSMFNKSPQNPIQTLNYPNNPGQVPPQNGYQNPANVQPYPVNKPYGPIQTPNYPNNPGQEVPPQNGYQNPANVQPYPVNKPYGPIQTPNYPNNPGQEVPPQNGYQNPANVQPYPVNKPVYVVDQDLPYPVETPNGFQTSPTNVQPSYAPGNYNPLERNPPRGETDVNEAGYNKCPADFSGLMPHTDCHKFLSCANGRTYVMDCAQGTKFSPELSMCDHAYKVKCGSGSPQHNSQPQENTDVFEPAESKDPEPDIAPPDDPAEYPDVDYTPAPELINVRTYGEINRATTAKPVHKPHPDNPELKGFFVKPVSEHKTVFVNKSVEIVTSKSVPKGKSMNTTPQPTKFQPGAIVSPEVEVTLGKQIKHNRQIVRLRGGPTQFQGYVEIKLEHTWGTVCDQRNQWTQTEANIVCKNLGYERGAESSWQGKPASVTEDVSQIVAVDVVKCVGHEKSILECFMTNNPFCDVNNDAVWVRCYDNVKSQCRPGEISIGDRCYFVVTPSEDTPVEMAGFTQGEAISHCQKHGGHLLNIGSQIENDFLSEWLMRQSQLETVMTAGVGVSVMGMPIWIWEGSEEPFTYHNWWPGWRSTKSVAPKLETSRASCIVLKRFFPCTELDTKEGRLCDAQYYYWDVDDCSSMSVRMPYICKRPANKIGCTSGTGINYRGGANVTSQGNLCLAWDSKEVTPFLKYKISDEDKRLSLSGHNYCRNVGGTDIEPWCFVKSKDAIQKEYCDIPICSKERVEKSAKFTEYKCGLKQFSCQVKRECIQQEWVCDGKPDCSNARDELDCLEPVQKFQHFPHTKLPGYDIEKHSDTTLKLCAEKCLEMENCRSFYFMEISKECFLSESNVGLSGNLIPNEIGWNYYERKSKAMRCSGLYLCDNGKCLSHSSVCNGKNDCGDKSDEKNCTWLEKGIQMKLTGGKVPNEGTIELKAKDQWGLICDDQFDMKDAHVICRHLGFPKGALEIKKHSAFGKTNVTKYLIDDLNCSGNETIISECEHNGWGVHDCGPDEAAGVVCKLEDVECSNNYWLCDNKADCIPLNFLCDNISDCTDGSDEISSRCKSEVSVRLVGMGGESRSNKVTEGRLEVKRFGVWGTVCDDDFGPREAEVVCNSLGYQGSAKVFKEAAFGAGSGIIWLDQVHCAGNETNVAECLHDSWGLTNCKHNEDVAIACSPQKINMDVGQDIDDYVPTLTMEQILPQTCGIVSLDVGPITPDFKPKVVSGFETIKGSYPWQASVRVKSVSGQSTHWCGAVVISRYHVLTAGHCLRDYVKSSYFIRAGDYDTEVIEDSEQDMDLEGIWIHQELDQGMRLNNDIALVKVKKPGFNLNKWVYPACLPLQTKDVYETGLNCTISGWGSSGVPGSGFARTLHATWLPVIPQEQCKTSYGRKSITDGMFCAGSLKGGADSCQGDSGGPIICPAEDGMTLFGITSWGHGCGRVDSPGVYTNVTYYMDWIRDKIENSM